MRKLLSLLALTCLASTLRAEGPPAPQPGTAAFSEWWNGKTLTSSWFGLGPRMEERGLEFFGYYTNVISSNVKGGRRRDNAYADDFFFGVNLDLEKLAGWRGAKLTISGVNRDGVSIRNDVGSIYDPMQLYGAQATYLYNVALEQSFFEDRFSLKVGRFGASDDFNSSLLYSYYLTNGINGNIRNVLYDTGFTAYPYSSWAARLKWKPTKETYVEAGIYQTSPNLFDPSKHGLDWGFDEFTGYIALAQVGWEPELFKRPVPTGDPSKDGKQVSAPAMKGLPGQYFLGASYSNSDYTEFQDNRKSRGSYGFYAHLSQMVYQEAPGSEQGLTVWAATGYYPQEDISIVPYQLNGGLIYRGPFPRRDDDRIILGVVYGRLSRDYAAAQKAALVGDPTYELVLEASYRIQLNKWAYVQPDFQWVNRPGGTGHIPDAYILGAMMGVTF